MAAREVVGQGAVGSGEPFGSVASTRWVTDRSTATNARVATMSTLTVMIVGKSGGLIRALHGVSFGVVAATVTGYVKWLPDRDLL